MELLVLFLSNAGDLTMIEMTGTFAGLPLFVDDADNEPNEDEEDDVVEQVEDREFWRDLCLKLDSLALSICTLAPVWI